MLESVLDAQEVVVAVGLGITVIHGESHGLAVSVQKPASHHAGLIIQRLDRAAHLLYRRLGDQRAFIQIAGHGRHGYPGIPRHILNGCLHLSLL